MTISYQCVTCGAPLLKENDMVDVVYCPVCAEKVHQLAMKTDPSYRQAFRQFEQSGKCRGCG